METSTELTPSPGEAARAEHMQILTNPQHSMHEGYKRGDSAVLAHITELYRKGPSASPTGNQSTSPEPAPPPDRQPQDMPLSPDARAAKAELDGLLRSAFGERYDDTMAAMHSGVSRLFSTPDHVKAFDMLAPIISELGPQAEVASIQFLAQLGRLTNK